MAKPEWDDTEPLYDETEAVVEATVPKFDDTEELSAVDLEKHNAFLRGAGQGASLGFADELAGALKSPLGAAEEMKSFLPWSDGPNASDEDLLRYRKERDEARAINDAVRKDSPVAFGAGTLAGAIPTAIATGGLASAGVAPGAAVGLGRFAALAAAEGAVTGTGSSEATTGADLAQDAAVSGALGAVTAGATNKFGGANVLSAGAGAYGGSQLIDEDDTLGEKAAKIAGGAAAGLGAKQIIGAAGSGLANVAKNSQMGQNFTEKLAAARDYGVSLFDKKGAEKSVEAVKEATEGLYGRVNEEKQVADKLLGEAREVSTDAVRNRAGESEEAVSKMIADAEAQAAKQVEASKAKIANAKEQVTDLRKKMIEFGKKVAKNDTVEQKNKLAKEIYQDTAKLSDEIEATRKEIGSNINEKLMQNQDKVMSTWELTRDMDTVLDFVKMANPQEAPLIDGMKAELSQYAGDFAVDKFMGLRRLLQKNASNTSLSPQLRKVYIDHYGALKSQIDDAIPGLNPLYDQYSNIFALKSATEKVVNPDKLRAIAANMAKTGGEVASAKANTGLGALRGLKPGLAQTFEEGIVPKVQALQSVQPKPMSAIQDQVEEELQSKYTGLVNDANARPLNVADVQTLDNSMISPLKVTDEAIEAGIDPALKKRGQAIEDFQQVAGKPKELPSLDTRALPRKSFDILDRQSKLNPDIKPKDLQDKEQFTKLLTEVVGEKEASELIQKNIEARDIMAMYGFELENAAATTDFAAQALKQAKPLASLVGNALGLGLRKMDQSTVIKTLRGASQASYGQAADAMEKAGNTKLAQKLRKAGDTQDPVSRAAAIFMVNQDPGFRTLLKLNESENDTEE